MATFKFFNIGKANEEITRLEAENAQCKADLKTANDNSEQIATAAQSNAELLAKCQTDLAAATTSIATITARAEKAESDLKVANEKLANPSEQIKQAAARKAQEITASQGQPPVKAETGAGPAAGDIVAQHAAIKDPVAKLQFYRKNKAAYDAAWAAQNPAKP